jgi:hypothetical protein
VFIASLFTLHVARLCRRAHIERRVSSAHKFVIVDEA